MKGPFAEIETGGGTGRDEELALAIQGLRWLRDTENVIGNSEERSQPEIQIRQFLAQRLY